MGVHHQTVQRCVERALACGPLAALDDLPRPGREPQITAEAKAWIADLACRKAKDLGYPRSDAATSVAAAPFIAGSLPPGHLTRGSLAMTALVPSRPALIEARDRPGVGRHAIGEVEHDLIDITPSPSFRRVESLDDGMSGRMEVLGCMASRRIVTASDMPACAANPEMNPGLPYLQALLTAERTRDHVAYRAQMRAGLRHDVSSLGQGCSA
jgi:hypothetical protein